MTKIDPYKHKERYFKWKTELQAGIPGISKYNSDLLINYVLDMEKGINVALFVKRGSRSYIRLNTLRTRILSLMKDFEKRLCLTKVTDLTEQQLHDYFLSMRNGEIKRKDGKNYRAVKDYVKDNHEIRDITSKIDKILGKAVLETYKIEVKNTII